MVKIGDITLKNNIISAPMAGISNPAFRSINIAHQAGLVVSEMISDKAICYRNKKTLEMLKIYDDEHPIAIQLFGGEVKTMVEAVKYINDHINCDIIDINMGCPVKKVIKANAGSYLMNHEELAFSIVKSIVDAIDKPVTVKFRLGIDDDHINCVEFGKLMEKAGAKAITLHARTAKQMYSGKPKYEYIKLLKENVNIPVFANGDIVTPKQAIDILKETGCDGIAIARGSIGNPWIFEQTKSLIENTMYCDVSLIDKKNLIIQHTNKLIDLYGEITAIKMMRGLIGYYFKGFEGASNLRNSINLVDNFQMFKEILDKYIK